MSSKWEKKSDVTPYNIGQPGGPSGPFFSVVSQSGQVIAMQIPEEGNAVAIANLPLLAQVGALARRLQLLLKCELLVPAPQMISPARASVKDTVNELEYLLFHLGWVSDLEGAFEGLVPPESVANAYVEKFSQGEGSDE